MTAYDDNDMVSMLWDWRRQTAALYGRVRAAADPRAAWDDWRETRDALFREHPQSPIDAEARGKFPGLAYYDFDPGMRFEVGYTPLPGGTPINMELGRDGLFRMEAFARTEGLAGPLGVELTLYWIAGYGGGTFVPFSDATTGGATFGGGRYLLDTIKGADLGTNEEGRLVLDFNFAYNPSCAYSHRFICPLAPAANAIPITVEVGERLGGGQPD
jgi:uncharacterized protein (DUF1684 family)